MSSPVTDELILAQTRCAFCLNTGGATHEVAVKLLADGSAAVAYLCDDCHSVMAQERRYPKFGHKIDAENKKVVELDIEEFKPA